MIKNNIVKLTDSAYVKLRELIKKSDKLDLGLRVYISSGGCNGFRYGFILENLIKKNDIVVYYNSIKIIIDSISIRYISGCSIDYIEKISGSKFILKNPKIKNRCSCGISFSI